jgi:formylglycine-generating enzyme required for sulfatase activity
MPGSCAATDILNVGSKSMVGDGKWGQADLAGNVKEWTFDWYDPYLTQCVDCALVDMGAAPGRVFRGGDWADSQAYVASSFRNLGNASFHFYSVGARCARTP